ncbi:MAG: hypothetical protein KY447_08530 [Actinobacteria bacterium]|nr:hypothetical protein [Actinomycetota bacterium]
MRRADGDGELDPAGVEAEAGEPPAEVQEALARYQAGTATDHEMVVLMQQLINTGSIRALRGTGPAGGEPPQIWATIIPVGGRLDIWIDGERRGSAGTPALARYRVVAAARPAKVRWADPFTAFWSRPRA